MPKNGPSPSRTSAIKKLSKQSTCSERNLINISPGKFDHHKNTQALCLSFFAWLMHVQYLNLAAGTREPGSKIVPICRPVNVIDTLGLREERHLYFVLKEGF